VGGVLKFVCSTCWLVFENGGMRACAGCGTASPPLGWPTLPYEFRERYLFVEQLGRGGQGAVFRAYDRQTSDEPWVAVKVAQVKSEALKEVFRREGRAAAMLSEHPKYFVGFRGSDFSEPAYLVLEFVPWTTLRRMHALEGNLHPLDVARLGVEILRGVRCMERRAMVHRDLKPDNIFAHRCGDDSFEVKIADLGVWIDSGASEESLLGRPDDKKHFFGTPPYMSPEQIRGDPVTAASDVHAVASVLWQLCTGALPFPMKAGVSIEERIADRLQQYRHTPPRPPSMPEELYLILAVALRYNPEERVFLDPQTLVGTEIPGHASAARGMEKALRRFIDEYAERRERALREAFAKLRELERFLTEGEKKIVTAHTLMARAQDFRARLAGLTGVSSGFEPVLETLRVIEPQVHAWNAAIEAFLDTGRAEIDRAAGRFEAESRRAAELERRLRLAEERAANAEADLSAEIAERSLKEAGAHGLAKIAWGALICGIGLCAGWILSLAVSAREASSGLEIPSAQGRHLPLPVAAAATASVLAAEPRPVPAEPSPPRRWKGR
jgi:Protein kinase domain